MKNDLSRLCIHTITTKPWPIETAIEKYVEKGIGAISVWRNYLEGHKLENVHSMIQGSGLTAVSLVRGGFFTGLTRKVRALAIDDNRRAIEEASAIGADMVVLVCGASPGQSLENSRTQIRKGIDQILPMAEENRIRLAIEPLHPMYADSRSAINTLQQANTMAEHFNSEYLGIAVDVYHVWWDENLAQQISRCSRNGNLFAFHLCDWKHPTQDMLNDRGIMGEGIIPLQSVIDMIKSAGFDGFHEVEIFSLRHWAEDQDVFLERIIEAYLNYKY